MTAETYLKQYLACNVEIARLEAECDTFSEIDDTEREWIAERYERMRECRKKQRLIISQIDEIDSEVLRSILSFRYICGMTWESIASRLGYDRSYVTKYLRPNAYKVFEKLHRDSLELP